MKNYILFTIFMSILLSVISLPASFGQSNPNLYVSAENTFFENHFAGPMVIEVTLNDSDISHLTDSLQEPIVTINDKTLKMVQSNNGKWHGYFADKTQAQQADSLVGLLGHGLDFGKFCSSSSSSSFTGLILVDTSGFTVPRDISSGTNGKDPLATCSGKIESTDALINNVVREAPTLNKQSDSTGRTGINEYAWPLIQLYDFTSDSDVTVKYKKASGEQSVVLKFNSADKFATMTLDAPFYRLNQNVKINVTDVMLNIDPTDEDSWTWASTSDSGGLYYQLFDENGERKADGTAGAVNIKNADNLAVMMFGDNGIFSLDPNSQNTPPDVVILQDNNFTILDEKSPSDGIVNLGTSTISHTDYPITFTETASNSASFVNYDKNGTANLIINSETKSGKSALVKYNDKSSTIVTKIGSPPNALDIKANTAKDKSIVFTVINNSTDPDGDKLSVEIANTQNLDGTAIVNSNNTITFTPNSSFDDRTSFVYKLDDNLDGSDTGTITISLQSTARPGSISGINLSSDKSNYNIGDTVALSWTVPNDSFGTSAMIEVSTPRGTSESSNSTKGTTFSIQTGNFTEGNYNFRIEHGQYYGEKSFPFKSSGANPPASKQVNAKDDTSDSCATVSKISTSLSNTSFTKNNDISVSIKLCDVVTNEFIILKILKPDGSPIKLDQFTPPSADFNKQYLTKGAMWNVDGKYTIQSTYLKKTVESTFDFIATIKEVPKDPVPKTTTKTPDPAPKTTPKTPEQAPKTTKTMTSDMPDSIAPFVESNVDPQYYVDRYNNEESYKEWFDTNYPQYGSIHTAVGLDSKSPAKDKTPISEPDTSDRDSSDKDSPASEPQKSQCGKGTELRDGACRVINSNTPPTCGEGTELRDGVCHVIQSSENTNAIPVLDSLFKFFTNLFR